MNYSLYKQAAKLIKLASPVLFNDSEQYDNLADGIETVPENDSQISGTSTASDPITNYYTDDSLADTVHAGNNVVNLEYSPSHVSPGTMSRIGTGFNVGMNGLIAHDAINRMGTLKNFSAVPHPTTDTAELANYVAQMSKQPAWAKGIRMGMNGMNRVFAPLEAYHAVHNAKEMFDPENTGWNRAAYGLRSGLNTTNALGMVGHIANSSPKLLGWLSKPGMRTALQLTRSAGEMLPTAFFGEAVLAGGQYAADRLNNGRKNLEMVNDAYQDNIQNYLDFMNTSSGTDLWGGTSERIKDQIPTSFADTLQMYQRSLEDESEKHPELNNPTGILGTFVNPYLRVIGESMESADGPAFDPGRVERLNEAMQDIRPEAVQKRMDQVTNNYNDQLNYVVPSQTEEDINRRNNESFTYTNKSGRQASGNGGQIYNSAAREAIKKEDPYITRFGYLGNPWNAGGDYVLKVPGEVPEEEPEGWMHWLTRMFGNAVRSQTSNPNPYMHP